MKRFLSSLIALVAVAALLAGCGDYDERKGSMAGDAATVNDSAITNEALTKELDALAANKGLVEAAKAQGQVLTNADGKIDPGLAASWLQQDISWVLLEQMAKDLDVKVTDANRKAAEKSAESAYPSPEIWAAFPEWFRDAQVEALAKTNAVVDELTKKKPTDADLKKIMDTVPEGQLPQMQCISHILLPAADTAKAAELKKEIDNGADFATLARENSTDGSKDQGGSLGCTRSDNSGYDPTFQQAADAATVGKVTDPVSTQFGNHLILVTDRHTATLEDLRADLTKEFTNRQIQAYVTKFNEKAKVKVAPRWGTVALSDGQWVVSPPVDQTSTTTAPAANTTGPAAATTAAQEPATSAP